MNNKCLSCGTVNWADATVCVRCSRSPTDSFELGGLERLEAQSDRKGMPVGVYLMFGLVAFAAVFVGIKIVKDSKVEAARVAAKTKADAEEAAADQKLWAEAQAAADTRFREEGERLKAHANKYQGLSPSRFDYQTMLKNQPPPSGWSPNQKFGGYSGPPPGTVYHMDKYGGMHQR